ncbi:S41 family peptidase [Pedobacter frigiditerrae]|uniref:S41 family peptidase n=1 Tax=Pedobacter frigiditerrae TaxID=2530452 RepID=UPI00292EB223|nr:S41 family peptidase [Pedobacter frigiditerrae]
MKINKIFALLAIVIFTLAACKKTKVSPTPTPPVVVPPVVTATRAELSKDSIFLYAKQIYLWNDKLPTYEVFNPRKYTSNSTELSNYEQELFEITKYSNPYEYKTGGTSSKYSYIFDKANKNATASLKTTASVDLEGNGNDLGIRFGFYGTDASFTTYVTAVYQNSPAEKAGLVRGNLITKINGVTVGSNFSTNLNFLNTALAGTTISLEGLKNDGTSFSVTLLKSLFKSSPIYKTKILTAGSKKVGYLAYARFSNAENSIAELEAAFTSFVAGGVTDLIIDLRYNGGGYVSTAQHLINLIAPSTATGTMFTEYYNATMQGGSATILANQPLLDENDKLQYRNGKIITYADVDYSIAGNTEIFAKKGSLTNVKNVIFIVSGSTASASELVINSLKPHMTVQLVGLTTYGKPVGFFPITIENKYDVYYSLFETKNSLGQGGYYDGLVPDLANRAPEVPSGTIMYDFGNPNDNYLKIALGLIAPGVTVTSQARTMTAKQKELASPSSAVINTDLSDHEFKGMIDTKHKIKQ